ncbi:helix-turn-helix domain-containing protein [Janthinobacterium fluminis]|uniref:HTH iclR-type domain-containing protein n=1 Tax=Janthinobacterium fluminis TaxID=2987524 RepID=A0ABT5K499_9BURK|nr:helix-turn-helix domain-containing protein [Janthinobacterium fluminis]MDC8758577.1 hypothetical protein [Janthinobacterium fluminis]
MDRYGRSRRSRDLIVGIARFIEERGEASAAEVLAHTGTSAGTVSRYLRHMCEVGMLHLAARHCTLAGSQRAAVYACGPAEEAGDCLGAQRGVTLRAQWPQGRAVRDPLVAALFGPAGAALSKAA